MSESSQGYTGWYRLGRALWVRVLDAATEGEAWQRLPDAAPPARMRDMCVLPVGVDPNVRRSPGAGRAPDRRSVVLPPMGCNRAASRG